MLLLLQQPCLISHLLQKYKEWINPTTGDSPVLAAGLEARLGIRWIGFGIRRFGLAGALVVRQRG